MSEVLEIDIGNPALAENLRRSLAQLYKAGIREPGKHRITVQHAAFVQLAQLQLLEQVRIPIGAGDFKQLQILKIRKIVAAEPVRQNIEIETIVGLIGVPIPDGPVLSLADTYLMKRVPEDVKLTLATLLEAGLGEAGKPLNLVTLQTIGVTEVDAMALTRTVIPPIYGQPSTRAFARSFRDLRGDGGEGIALNISLVQ